GGVGNVADVLLRDVVAAAPGHHLHVLLRHHPAGGVRHFPDAGFRDVVAALPRHHLHVLLGDHAAGGVRHRDGLDLGHAVAALAGHHPAVLLGHRPAGGVADRPADRVRHLAADLRGHGVVFGARHLVALADDAVLLARHPDPLADGVAGALHLVADHRAGAALRRAGAGVEHGRAGHPAAAGHHRAGDVLLHRLPAAGADLHAPLGHDVLTDGAAAHLLPRLCHRAPARLRDVADVLLVDRPVGAVVLRHLVVLDLLAVGRVAV